MDCIVHGVAKSWTRLSDFHFHFLSLHTYTYTHTLYTHTHAHTHTHMGFPGGSDCKESAFHEGDPGPIPGSGRSPGEENGNPLQFSHLGIPWTEEPGGLPFMGSQRVRHN